MVPPDRGSIGVGREGLVSLSPSLGPGPLSYRKLTLGRSPYRQSLPCLLPRQPQPSGLQPELTVPLLMPLPLDGVHT